MKIKFVIISALIFFLSCDKKKLANLDSKNIQKSKVKNVANDSTKIEFNQYLSYLSDYKKMYQLRKKMIAGDTLLYYDIKNIYFLSGQSGGFTTMALIMANKTSFPAAYYDVYEALHGIDNHHLESSEFVEVGLSKLDPETRNLAFSYLKKAAKKGHKDAVEELKKYDKNGDLRK